MAFASTHRIFGIQPVRGDMAIGISGRGARQEVGAQIGGETIERTGKLQAHRSLMFFGGAIAGVGALSVFGSMLLAKMHPGGNPFGAPALAAGLTRGGEGNVESAASYKMSSLPWPKNDTPFSVQKAYSWDAKMANPNDPEAGKNLPYYGKATALDVTNHITAVWNACKDIRHIPGEKLSALSDRIQGRVNTVIQGLGYKPTLAHELALRGAGNDTFLACNGSDGVPTMNGQPVTTGVLGIRTIVTFSQSGDQQCLDMAQALLKCDSISAGCVPQAALLMALDHEAGIQSFMRSGYARKPVTAVYNDLGAAERAGRGHVTVARALPTKDGCLVPQDKWATNYGKYVMTVVTNPSWLNLSAEQKGRLDDVHYFPKPHESLVGAKGDDGMYVLQACEFINGYKLLFRVSGIPFDDEGANARFDVSAAAGLQQRAYDLSNRILAGESL